MSERSALSDEHIQRTVEFLRERETRSERIQNYLEQYEDDEQLSADIRAFVQEEELPPVSEAATSGEAHPTTRLNWRRVVIAALKVASLCVLLRRVLTPDQGGRLSMDVVKKNLEERYPEIFVLSAEIVNEMIEAFVE